MGNVQKALDLLNKKVLKKGEVISIYKNRKPANVKRLRTGILGLDVISGGGWVRGLINYIAGWESSGKSTACLYAIRECQKEGGIAAYIDHEYSFDKEYAESLGINVDDMIISQPDTIEDGYTLLLGLLDIEGVELVVFDSIAAALTKKEIEGDVGDSVIGVKARINSASLSRINSKAHANNKVVLMVNQLREKIGVMFGSPVTEPGGNSLKFYPGIKIEVRQSTKEKEDDEVIGNLIKAKCTKNKTYRPFLTAEYHIYYGEGVDRLAEVIQHGVDFGIIDQSGSWYSYDGTRLGQGKDNVKKLLEDNPELVEKIENLIYKEI